MNLMFSVKKGLHICSLIKFSLFHNFVGSIAEKYFNPYIYPDEIITNLYAIIFEPVFAPFDSANRNIARDPRGIENRQEQRIIILL